MALLALMIDTLKHLMSALIGLFTLSTRREAEILILRHTENNNQLIFIEEWDSEEDYKAYLAWRKETGVSTSAAWMMSAPQKTDIWKGRVA